MTTISIWLSCSSSLLHHLSFSHPIPLSFSRSLSPVFIFISPFPMFSEFPPFNFLLRLSRSGFPTFPIPRIFWHYIIPAQVFLVPLCVICKIFTLFPIQYSHFRSTYLTHVLAMSFTQPDIFTGTNQFNLPWLETGAQWGWIVPSCGLGLIRIKEIEK